MKKHLVAAILPLTVLFACSESPSEEAPAAPDPLEELAAGTGPYLVTYADGTKSLWFATPDGVEYGGPTEGPVPATWSVVDGNVCVDLPDPDADPSTVCLENGELGEDGTWKVNQAGAPDDVATMRRLDLVASTPADQIAAGTYLLDFPDGTHGVVYWGENGETWASMNAEKGTWRADGTQRCEKLDSAEEETCGAPTSEIGADGSFSAEDGQNGSITVTML